MANKEVDYAFLLASFREEGGVKSDERYMIMKMENGLKAPRFGTPFPEVFNKKEKERLEALLKKVQTPGFKS